MSRCSKVSIKCLKEIENTFYLDEGGVLRFQRHRYKRLVGSEVARNQKTKRKIVWCGGKGYPVHRVVYFIFNGVWPSGVVDHIDGNPSNNHPNNLRDVTQSLNTRSFGPSHRDSSSKYRGVHWFKRDSRWQAQIMCEGKREHLGYFNCEKEAALAWNYKADKLGFNKEAFNKVFE